MGEAGLINLCRSCCEIVQGENFTIGQEVWIVIVWGVEIFSNSIGMCGTWFSIAGKILNKRYKRGKTALKPGMILKVEELSSCSCV